MNIIFIYIFRLHFILYLFIFWDKFYFKDICIYGINYIFIYSFLINFILYLFIFLGFFIVLGFLIFIRILCQTRGAGKIGNRMT